MLTSNNDEISLCQTRNKEALPKWTKANHTQSRPNIVYGLVNPSLTNRQPRLNYVIFIFASH